MFPGMAEALEYVYEGRRQVLWRWQQISQIISLSEPILAVEQTRNYKIATGKLKTWTCVILQYMLSLNELYTFNRSFYEFYSLYNY